jgi:predicted transcriptional regulator
LYLLSFLDRTSIGKQVSFPLRHMDFIYWFGEKQCEGRGRPLQCYEICLLIIFSSALQFRKELAYDG